jgi:hypothetical protein
MFKNETFLELYDVINDLQELKNLAFDQKNKQLVLSLMADLKNHMAKTNDLITLEENVYQSFLTNYQFSKAW